MSPVMMHTFIGNLSFPRVSGDEPDALLSVYPDQMFSPRERG